MLPTQILGMRKARLSPSRKMCSTNSILVDFGHVIQQLLSFHSVYDLLLLQFVLGASFISPGLRGNTARSGSRQAVDR